MLDRGQDVELLAPVGPVAVADQPELLEDVEGPVDRRRRRLRVDLAAALDELAAGDVPVRPRQDVDERPALRRPAQTALVEALAEVRPVRSAAVTTDRPEDPVEARAGAPRAGRGTASRRPG